MKLMVCNSPEMKARRDSIIATLKGILEEAEGGELLSVEIVFSRYDKTWGTVASQGTDRRASAAMLMELAMRRLGFELGEQDDAT